MPVSERGGSIVQIVAAATVTIVTESYKVTMAGPAVSVTTV